MSKDPSTIIQLRRHLHTLAEVAHKETKTAKFIAEQLEQRGADQIVRGLGGHGIAALYKGKDPGPSVLLRSELDALPIPESRELAHRSQSLGVSHRCGHDGHMAILLGVANHLAEHPPATGLAILLFQPAEETGEGAARVIADPQFGPLKPDHAFALHNLPQFPASQVIIRPGQFAATSRGIIVRLSGSTSHAAQPEQGTSPTMAVANLLTGLSALPQLTTPLHQAAKVTVIHASLGEVAFGTSPGDATVMATLRAFDNEVMRNLSEATAQLAQNTAKLHGLSYEIEWREEFPATINDDRATSYVMKAAQSLGLKCHIPNEPFAWTEDFGHFTTLSRSALFGLGAGIDHPVLHSPEYDFPDEIIETGTGIFVEILHQLLG